jgi:hypothetical protein
MWLRSVAALALLAWPVGTSSAGEAPLDAGELPEYRIEDPDAPIVTESNLLASERFWPYQVGLTRSLRPAGSDAALPLGTSGVLIRVVEGGVARVDFGRDGLFDVPVGATDLVERANRVRRGELEKTAPNYVLALGTRLADSSVDPPRGFSFRDVIGRRGFVSVFADPLGDDFAAIAASLAPLRERPDVLVLLFPQGGRRDPEVYEKLRGIDWTVPFVLEHLTAPYTQILLSDDVAPPAVLVQTAEGRLLWSGRWSSSAVAELLQVVDGAFAPAAAPAP